MNAFPGAVVLVRFPFSDIASSKQRPALVLSLTGKARSFSLITVAMITSRIDAPKLAGDVTLLDWEKAGLLHSSKARLSKIVTLDTSLVRKELGRLTDRDRQEVRTALQTVFSTWI